MAKKYTAGCACSAVRFEFNTDPDFIAVCHCLDCKKASGGEAATWFGVPESDFSLTEGQPKAYSYVADSGGKLERNLCPTCGARVYTSNLTSFPGLVFVQLGSLDRPEAVTPKLEMFVKRRLPWVARPPGILGYATLRALLREGGGGRHAPSPAQERRGAHENRAKGSSSDQVNSGCTGADREREYRFISTCDIDIFTH